jgi:hypothetical protein
LFCLTAVGVTALPAAAQWVVFQQDPSRLVASPGLGATDPEEKDYAWGDVDLDGDIDLVVVRKQPFTSQGKRVNVLFMNENSVLVDRTGDYATAADVAGDQGFNTATNDRDVVLFDANNDGWLDIVTATTLTDNQAKHISHPRIYINLGDDAQGNWLGFRFENFRIPQMHPTAGPRFCSVAAGDVTGDGFADIYFGDYDSGGAMIMDYNNRLLINNGAGVFSDQSTSRLTSEMTLSAFGAASVIADINDDGVMDVVKQTSLNPPQHIAVTYNNPANEGFFNLYDVVVPSSAAPYFVSVGDLNNDGKLDLVETDDNTDKYLLQTTLDAQGQANFTTFNFPGDTNGFGSQSVIADLNNDGWNDVLIADVDVDISGCTRTSDIMRNLGNAPNVTFQVQGQVIPNANLVGVHNFAVFDLNGDGWLDVVVGRCTGTQIWMNQPPFGLTFSYPQGLPSFLPVEAGQEILIQLTPIGGGQIQANSVQIHTSVNGAPYTSALMTAEGSNQYSATLPELACTDSVNFYFSAGLTQGGTFSDPSNAPASSFSAVAAAGTEITLLDEVEGDVSAWSVVNSNLTSGAWQQAAPNATFNGGAMVAPDQDATQGSQNTMAFVTDNGAPGEAAGTSDVDGGPTRLLSPVIDLDGTDAVISYARWFYSDGTPGSHVPDFMTVDVSNNGGTTWVNVPSQTTGGTGSAWEIASFQVGAFVQPTAQVRVRFNVDDNPNNSFTEGGIDNFSVEVFDCGKEPNPCPADVTNDGIVDVQDLVAVVLDWGCVNPPGPCNGDTNGDGAVNVQDLVDAILAWGPCP